MKTYKLTPLEELQLEKKRVSEERTISSQRLVYQLKYLNDNWSSMLTKGVASSIKSRLYETIDNLPSGSSASATPFVTKKANRWFSNTAMNIVMANLPLIGSVLWGLAKPSLVAYGTKKLTSLLFGRKRKKK